MKHRTMPARLTTAVLLAALAGGALAEDAGVPRHLALARELVENTRPQNNLYKLGGRHLSFASDPAGEYAVRADCSGFLLALFERAGYPTQSRMGLLPSSFRKPQRRAVAEDFVYSLEREMGYRRIRGVHEMRPGDLLAHAMLRREDQQQTGTTGHVYLLDSAPGRIPGRSPVVAGTQQYEVRVIDSNHEYTGPDDTRTRDPSNKVTGVGRGTIRLYADASGELVGWARTYEGTKRFFSYDPRFPSSTKLRKAAVGRPVP
jgi:hypothetical protein